MITLMNKKEVKFWLSNRSKIDIEMNMLRNELRELMNLEIDGGITQILSHTPSAGNNTDSKIEKAVIKKENIYFEYSYKLYSLLFLKMSIEKIYVLLNDINKRIFDLRYDQGEKWENISEKVNLSCMALNTHDKFIQDEIYKEYESKCNNLLIKYCENMKETS